MPQKRHCVALQGMAAWYSKDGDHTDPWRHTKTANGELFNEDAATAASWDFPLGTRVAVTNRKNGRTVIVRINDRGPSKRLRRQGRIIDLTKGAFERIGNLNDGIIAVMVQEI